MSFAFVGQIKNLNIVVALYLKNNSNNVEDESQQDEKKQTGKTDDPVRLYIRDMGAVELLSREGEIAIAKRIEAGREKMIGAICESPMTIRSIKRTPSGIPKRIGDAASQPNR